MSVRDERRLETLVAQIGAVLDARAAEINRLKEAIRKHRETWMRPGADEELYAVLEEKANG